MNTRIDECGRSFYTIGMSMDRCVEMGCNDIMIIFYNPKLNIFYDIDGFEIHYLFELFTPSDIMLFKNNHENNIFVSRQNRKTMIEIVLYYNKE